MSACEITDAIVQTCPTSLAYLHHQPSRSPFNIGLGTAIVRVNPELCIKWMVSGIGGRPFECMAIFLLHIKGVVVAEGR